MATPLSFNIDFTSLSPVIDSEVLYLLATHCAALLKLDTVLIPDSLYNLQGMAFPFSASFGTMPSHCSM
ncbi:MAG: hypothetical protein IJR17_05380 [Clostridia bacterium]|nr:hypothetical protein [Clostridia bacterium]